MRNEKKQMKRKVLVEKKENHVWTFFLEEDQIAEIHCAKSDEQEKVHQIGDMSPKCRISYRI